MGRTPTQYGGLSDAELAAALLEWFTRHGDRRDAWSRTITGRELKAQLVALGRFKHLPRGDPAKGRAAMIKGRAERGLPAPQPPDLANSE